MSHKPNNTLDVIPAQAGIHPEVFVFLLGVVRTALRLWNNLEMDPGLRRDDIVVSRRRCHKLDKLLPLSGGGWWGYDCARDALGTDGALADLLVAVTGE